MCFFAARRSCIIRAAPVITVINDPEIAATRNAIPTGVFHCQPKKWMVDSPRFWVIKINSTINVSEPAISAHHAAAVLVNGPGDSGPPVAGFEPLVSGGVCSGSSMGLGSGGSCGSLLISSSLPVRGQNQARDALGSNEPGREECGCEHAGGAGWSPSFWLFCWPDVEARIRLAAVRRRRT